MPHRVLIAGDRQTTVLIMSGALQEAGFEVAVARDGEECLALVRSFTRQLLARLDSASQVEHAYDGMAECL